LASRDARAALSSPLLWGGAILGALLAGVALHGRSAPHVPLDVVDDLQRPLLGGLGVATTFALSLVVGGLVGRARERGEDRWLWQLGHRASSIVVGWLAASALAFLVLASGVLAGAASLAVAGAHVDGGALTAGLLGHALYALAVAGTSALAASFASTAAGGRGLAVGASGVLWLLARTDAPGAFAMPSAPLALFERGLVDVRDVLSLGVGGLGCAVAAAMWRAPATGVERRAASAGLVLIATLALAGGASRVHRSFDWSADQRSSLTSRATAALSLVGDPVTVTTTWSADDPAFVELLEDVIVPMRRATPVRVERRERAASPVVWRVGAREASSPSTSANDAVRLVLELAGLPAPTVVDDRRPAPAFSGSTTIPLAAMLGAWPLVGIVALLITRRR
jgi:hypothetical protein